MIMKKTWRVEGKTFSSLFFFVKILLVDIGADNSLPQTLECGSRPLIDLSNTPEVNKVIPLKPVFSEQIKVSYI